ncbi:hypothetical protein COE80_19305 [Bacillus pseudomycoides]|uniref:hypothetical protein n=1 Tax=Bacillus pseudomycoides TaxID=64104 RepID=UPI000BFB98FA|nr:hypothetical protein [Bacillus pseudomycoides]PHB23062.1 hypothetical protein COE80_19305 [Bacillus pseudomycoides]PHE37592.1 hypothetical protein COF51_16270 [Bacillus pseudomycoides]
MILTDVTKVFIPESEIWEALIDYINKKTGKGFTYEDIKALSIKTSEDGCFHTAEIHLKNKEEN